MKSDISPFSSQMSFQIWLISSHQTRLFQSLQLLAGDSSYIIPVHALGQRIAPGINSYIGRLISMSINIL